MGELNLLKRRIDREIRARKAAESIIESKSLELYEAHQKLLDLNKSLEEMVRRRTIELTESEQKYRLLVETAKDIIYNSDPEGYITYTNQMAAEALGYKEDEIIGRHFTEFVVKDYMEEIMNYYIEMRDSRQEDSYMEIPVVTKDNRIIWLGQNVKRVQHGEEIVFSIVARDISIRKKIEQELSIAQKTLSLSERKYRSMIENMKLGILEVDNEGKVVKAYDGFCEMVEYPPEELIGLNPEAFLLKDEARKIIKEQHHRRGKGIAEIYEIPVITRSGQEKWMLISGAPFYNLDGEVIGSIGIHYDITYQKNLQKELEIARKRAEKAQEAEKLFLANMSHEIRTPLNAIIGMSYLLKDTQLDIDQSEFLSILFNSANLLHNLISDILDISKIDAGQIETKLAPVNLPKVLQTILNSFLTKAGDKSVSLELDIDKKINTLVLSDEILLNQILINLVGNAVKFTHEGKVSLSARVKSKKNQLMKIEFEVADTGIGIPKDQQGRVFEKFKQVSDTRRRKYTGTGLGLSITKSIVEILEGSISFESIEGDGSTFKVVLPFKDTRSKLQWTDDSSTIDKGVKFENKIILIAEDNPMNQKYICTLLDKWHLHYDLAEDGERAIEKAKTREYDLIFMDLQMPKIDGFKATQRILKDSLNTGTPIIALTASTFLTKKQMALEAGMADFLAKPFTPAQLSSILQKHLVSHLPFQPTSPEKGTYSTQLDDALLKNIYGVDWEYAEEMFALFLEGYQDEVAVLNSSIELKDFEKIKAQAHKMKPTYKMVGLSGLSENLTDMEKASADHNLKELERHWEHFTKDLHRKIPIVKRQRADLLKNLKQKNHEEI